MTWTRRGVLAAGLAGTAGCVGTIAGSEPGCFASGSADVRIGFTGDVMLGRGVNDRWADTDPSDVWGSALNRLRRLDGLFVNLECCLSDRGEPWPEKTFLFRADPGFAVPALSAADVSVAALGNNHVLDYGPVALEDTLAALDDADVAHAGAGPDRERAFTPAVTEHGGLTVATISLTDRFSAFAAGANEPGTAYSRLHRSQGTARPIARRTIEQAERHDPDLLVASLHWGPNWETEPDDSQRDFARWLIDQGVDVVHGHSAHLLQGVEVYRGRPIIYDAGDLVDDYTPKEDVHNKRSALFELAIRDGRLDGLGITPVEIRREAATLADGAVAEWVRTAMAERSAALGTSTERAGEGLVVPLGACRSSDR